MTTSDNPNNPNYKGQISQRWDLDLRGFVTKTDMQVPPNTDIARPPDTDVLDEQLVNERNVHKARLITETMLQSETVVDKFLGTAWEQLQRFAVSWTVEKDLVSISSVPTAGFYIVVGENREHNPASFKLDIYTVSAWQTLTSYEFDHDLGLLMTKVESVVAHGTAVPASTSTVGYEQRQVDSHRDILTSYTLPSAFDRTTYRSDQYTWPALLAVWDGTDGAAGITPAVAADLVGVSTFEEGPERTVFKLKVPLRDAFTEMTEMRVREEIISAATAATLLGAGADNTATFGTTTDLGSSTGTVKRARLWNPRPRDYRYDGLMVEYRLSNVLTDAMTLSFSANGSDTYYGSTATDSFSIPATNITATAYKALIGSTVCIEDSIEPWKYGMYRRRRVTVVVK